MFAKQRAIAVLKANAMSFMTEELGLGLGEEFATKLAVSMVEALEKDGIRLENE